MDHNNVVELRQSQATRMGITDKMQGLWAELATANAQLLSAVDELVAAVIEEHEAVLHRNAELEALLAGVRPAVFAG